MNKREKNKNKKMAKEMINKKGETGIERFSNVKSYSRIFYNKKFRVFGNWKIRDIRCQEKLNALQTSAYPSPLIKSCTLPIKSENNLGLRTDCFQGVLQ